MYNIPCTKFIIAKATPTPVSWHHTKWLAHAVLFAAMRRGMKKNSPLNVYNIA
jgi:hypothetical protein